jgi:transposase
METASKVARIGMDVHRRFSRVTARDQDQNILWRTRLKHPDRQALRSQLARWPAGTPVVLEGSFGWGWLADELTQANLEPRLASTRKVATWRQLHGLAKCDRNDADLLSQLAFEPAQLWEVWLPPPPVRERRELLRYRMALVHLQTGVKNRIHAILHRHGLFPEVGKLFGPTGRRWLQLWLLPRSEGLPASAREVLKGYLQLLDHLRLQIARVTHTFRRELTADPTARRLCTLPGVKWILGYTLLAEIGRIERFASAGALASYSLLAPRAHDSGQEDDDSPTHGRHVGHQGRRTLKWAYIEAAHGAVYRSPRLRRWFDHYTRGGRQNRNRGYIGVARRLSRYSYVVWKKEVDYQEEPPRRPGRGVRTGRTRPAQGQPAGAMVAVAEA